MSWMQYLGPPLLMVIGGIISWIIKSRIEELQATEEKLRSERRKIYGEILVPYIQIFTDLKGKGPIQAVRKITSFEYKRTAFELIFLGSDEVVHAYNNLMQYSYIVDASGDSDPQQMIKLWGGLLLEIRKSLGNKKTKLNEYDMFRSFLKDIDKYSNDINKTSYT